MAKSYNEYVGQLIYAGLLQHPGQARNAKNLLFSSSKIYNEVFRTNHDPLTIYDLVRLGEIYNQYSNKISKETDDTDKIALIKNGKFTVIGIVLYLYKKKVGLIEDYLDNGAHKDNINGLLITDYPGDDLEKQLFEFFDWLIYNLMSIYNNKKNDLKITSFSNFFKSESNYEVICKYFDDMNTSKYDKEKLDYYLKIFDKKSEL